MPTMPTLFVRCPRCGNRFPTPLAVASSHEPTLLVTGLPLECPRCGAEARYFTKDLLSPAEPASPGPSGASDDRPAPPRAGEGFVPSASLATVVPLAVGAPALVRSLFVALPPSPTRRLRVPGPNART